MHLSDPGSGGRVLTDQLIAAEGWSPDDIVDVPDVKTPDEAEALCDGEFDAFTIKVGHPSPLIKEAADSYGVVLVPVGGPSRAAYVTKRTAFS